MRRTFRVALPAVFTAFRSLFVGVIFVWVRRWRGRRLVEGAGGRGCVCVEKSEEEGWCEESFLRVAVFAVAF